MSTHRHDYPGLGEDAMDNSFSPVVVTATPSGAPTRQASGGTDWGNVISGAIPILLSAYQQQQMTKINVARINNGMPPLSTSEYVQVYRPPSAEVQIGATPQTQRLLMFGGLAVLGLVALRAARVI